MKNVQYDAEVLLQINESVNLIDYAGQTLELKKRGNAYYAHCPKHVDNTASLSFTPSKNMYHCFSCGRSGGIIKFLMDYEGMSFADAVEKAAKLASVDLSKMCQSDTILFLKRFKILNSRKIIKYEHPILDSKEILKYSKEPATEWIDEGISQETLDLFGVRIDTARNKIVYPVYDIDGNLINIKGRTRFKNYKALKIPKYINYYSVGVMDYFQGLNITLPYIQQKSEVIIFESIKSVMKCFDWKVKNCVSAETHTLTKEQIDILAKLKVNIVFAYDSDINYRSSDVVQGINKLKRITNVYIIKDKNNLLGGKETKNSPADLGEMVWRKLYEQKEKVV